MTGKEGLHFYTTEFPDDYNRYQNDNSMENTLSVLIAGFPQGTSTNEVREFIINIAPGKKHVIRTTNDNTFRGFQFVNFNSAEEANEFLSQEHAFNGKVLDCKIAKDHDDFIKTSLQNLKCPRIVFVDKIPKHMCKKNIEDIFSKFGKIEETLLIVKKEKHVNYAYVTFSSTREAIMVVTMKYIKLDKTTLRVVYSRPKFSNSMLQKIHPWLREHIKCIQGGFRQYCPQEFDQLEQSIQNSEQNLYYTGLPRNFDFENASFLDGTYKNYYKIPNNSFSSNCHNSNWYGYGNQDGYQYPQKYFEPRPYAYDMPYTNQNYVYVPVPIAVPHEPQNDSYYQNDYNNYPIPQANPCENNFTNYPTPGVNSCGDDFTNYRTSEVNSGGNEFINYSTPEINSGGNDFINYPTPEANSGGNEFTNYRTPQINSSGNDFTNSNTYENYYNDMVYSNDHYGQNYNQGYYQDYNTYDIQNNFNYETNDAGHKNDQNSKGSENKLYCYAQKCHSLNMNNGIEVVSPSDTKTTEKANYSEATKNSFYKHFNF